MAYTFVTTVVYLRDEQASIVIQAPTGQIEHGPVFPGNLEGSLEDHIARRIRELFNVGLCQGWRNVYISPRDEQGRFPGTTMVFEHDFDLPRGYYAGQPLRDIN